jgi:hypothetical protein
MIDKLPNEIIILLNHGVFHLTKIKLKNNKMKKTFAILLLTLFSAILFAQNETDALRYSLINYSGTARFMSMSGAYGALGANFSSLSQNPAGIGLYRKSEFSITPVLSSNNSESNYIGSMNTDARTTLYLANIGYVMSIKLNENNASHLKQIQFGFGMNRQAMFNNRMLVNGVISDTTGTLMLQYRDDADIAGNERANLDDFGAGLAYDANLLYQDNSGIWQVDLPYGPLQQTKSIENRGGITETVLSAGTNFDDKLFLGITFGFPHINYQEESTYTEKDTENGSLELKSYTRTEYLNTKGTGFNFKFGFIYKPVDYIRIGGAIHTPTAYNDMNDSYGATMTSYFDRPPISGNTSTRFEANSPDGNYDYKITTPMRALGSLAFIIGQYGLLSVDYEYIDYTTARLRFSASEDLEAMNTANGKIRSTLTSANNFRLGTEWKAGMFAFRGGYNLYGSPYKNEGMSGLGSRTGYSLGFGIQEKAYFLDFSYNHISSKDLYYIYGYAPASSNTYNSNSYSFTLGFRL